MGKKICFFDIDGTLASLNRSSMSDSTIEALNKLKENGVYVFINSGRMYSELPSFARDYDFDGYIMGCGIEALMHGQMLFENSFPEEMNLEHVFNRVKEFGLHAAFESNEDGALFLGDTPTLRSIKESFIKSGSAVGDVKGFKPFQKFVIYTTDQELADKFLEPYKNYIEYSKVFIGDLGLYEIVPANCTKAKGMERVIQDLNIENDDIYVFGDSGNDIPMLKLAKHSIVMANGTEEVKKYAEYITTSDCDHDGIYEACKHYGLI